MPTEELTEFEKLIQTTSQFATLIRAYYDALIENQFSHKDAMFLTVQYQKEVLGLARTNNTKQEE